VKKLTKILVLLIFSSFAVFASGCYFLPRLESPSNFRIDFQNNVMTWSGDERAVGFNIYRVGNDGFKGATSFSFWKMVQSPMLCIEEFDSTSLAFVSVSSDEEVRNSQRITQGISRHRTLSQPRLNVSESGVVSWEKDENATSYSVNIVSIPHPYHTINFSTTSPSFDIHSRIEEHCPDVVWGITVASIGTMGKRAGNGLIYLNSSFSGLARFPDGEPLALVTPLVELVGKDTNHPSLRWQRVYNNDGFEIFMNGLSVGTTRSTAFSLQKEMPIGTNTFTVRALHNSGSRIFRKSEFSDLVEFDVDRVFQAPSRVRIEEAEWSLNNTQSVLRWDAETTTRYFRIYINGRYSLTTSGRSIWLNSIGTRYTLRRNVDVQLRAVGRGRYSSSELSSRIRVML